MATSGLRACAIGIQTCCMRAVRGILHATYLALISEQLRILQSELRHLDRLILGEERPV